MKITQNYDCPGSLSENFGNPTYESNTCNILIITPLVFVCNDSCLGNVATLV